MTAIDWTRPLVTNAGKPIPNSPLANVWNARNATPAEILAHPDAWPDWQDWARKQIAASDAAVEQKVRAMGAEAVSEYDMSIHTNPDAMAWAKFFCETHPNCGLGEDVMLGWFANAMMAMHDHLTGQAPVVLPDGSAFFVGEIKKEPKPPASSPCTTPGQPSPPNSARCGRGWRSWRGGALLDAGDALATAAKPARKDPNFLLVEAVREIGEQHGYGALMTTASALWRETLEVHGMAGSEFAAGPCVSTAASRLARIDAALKGRADD